MNFLKMAIAAVGFALFPQVAVGDYFSAMEQCVTEATSAARMACVDAVTSEEDAQKRKGQQSYGGGGGGGGSRGPQKSAADSQKTLEYALRAKTQIEGSSSNYRPTMVFRCVYGEMLGYVIVGLDVQPDRISHSAVYTDAIFQVDQERAFRVELRVSNNGDRLYLPSTIELSGRVLGKDRLTVRVTPYDAEPAETTFDIEHFEKGIAPLRKACRW